ncbi:MAG: insulinase family protein [Ruminococcaceae bacterium]|nr:insulinase family protein [Oscillospiraceae bacterium]
MQLRKRTNTTTQETVYEGTHPSGLRICLMPKAGYRQNYAIFGTRYGSVDSEFIVPGETEITKVPDGIAHYLEHKMFDMPDGSNIFDRFAQYGANANAFTSFNMTAYLFSATSNLYENLSTLLEYVQTPHFTPESVEKEQGIIGQEIRMYDDNAGWKVFFNLLGCLYQNNPVKLEIAGTIDSIAQITSDYLYKCYNTFYNLSNMMLIVIGDIDIEKTVQTIDAGIRSNKPFDEEIKRIYPQEPEAIANAYSEQKLSVAQPLFMIGFKDRDVGYGGKPLLIKTIEMNILSTMLFGKGSELYKKLYDEGLINATFSAEFNPQIDYGFTAIEGESKNPKEVYEIITSYLESYTPERDAFERIKKVIWGDYIRSHNDIEEYAHTYLTTAFLDGDYFDYRSAYEQVSFESVVKRYQEHFKKEFSALSVILPTEA